MAICSTKRMRCQHISVKCCPAVSSVCDSPHRISKSSHRHIYDNIVFPWNSLSLSLCIIQYSREPRSMRATLPINKHLGIHINVVYGHLAGRFSMGPFKYVAGTSVSYHILSLSSYTDTHEHTPFGLDFSECC